MRLPLTPTPAFSYTLSHPPSSSDPPLVFIDREPFLVELQGSLELPGVGLEATAEEMQGVAVGKIDFDAPNKPILRISHHRLEGKLVTLTEPYAVLRTTPAPVLPPSKRARLDDDDLPSSSPVKSMTTAAAPPPTIEIVGLVRRKIVFSKRPEPLIELSSEAGGEH